MAERVVIRQSLLRNNDVAEWVRFTYYPNPTHFKTEFKRVFGIEMGSVETIVALDREKKINLLPFCKGIKLRREDLYNIIDVAQ